MVYFLKSYLLKKLSCISYSVIPTKYHLALELILQGRKDQYQTHLLIIN